MSSTKSKTFFTDLKETVGFINKRINDVTSAHSDIPTECNFSEVYQDLENKLNDIKDLKKDALALKKDLETKQDYFRNFFHDFQDLVLEIEEKVGWHEKYLQKFGYEPLNIEPVVEKEEVKTTTPAENNINVIKSTTPSICDFVAVEKITNLNKSAESRKKSSELDSSGGTPQLCFDQVFERCNKSPTMPVVEMDNAHAECFGDYSKLARKLDF